MIRALFFIFLISFSGLAANACGVDSDCILGERTYRIDLPEGVEAPGAIIFAHGYRGSAAGTMRNRNFRNLAKELGVAFVAVKSYGDDWRIPGTPSEPGNDGALELAYFDALVEELEAKYSIDTNRLLVSGFSAGGMMVWQLACDRPELFAGFAPVAGTFWAPVPGECAGAVNLFHTHGTTDRIVPLTGRPIASTRQGNVFKALEMLHKTGGYGEEKPTESGGMPCQRWENAGGKVMEFCTHNGGHSMRTAYIEQAWKRLEEIGAISTKK